MGFNSGFIDSFFLNKEPDNYTWWTVRVPTARPSNKVANRLLFSQRGLERKNKEQHFARSKTF
jgi:exonuclease III